ncbi:MAG: DUF4340 domain-containing protein [Phycisphaerales bacterium]|nr:DUF4340 domain-containing protein [Phycisphaerales bacterium]
MSLRTILISLIVAGVFAGLVLISASLRGSGSGTAETQASIRTLGFDPAAVVEVRVEDDQGDEESAFRESGAVDGWRVRLDEADRVGWAADSTRVRTTLRALASASLQVQDDESIGDLAGVLSLVDGDGMTTEVRFGSQAGGGFVPVEVVSRGTDGIASGRWFGRIERALRDSMIGRGLGSWRSAELFDLTVAEVFGAEVASGADRVVLERTSLGWEIREPWVFGADGQSVGAMVGLTLGLRIERFYDSEVYSKDLTGLGSPIATILVRDGSGVEHLIMLGSAVDAEGSEVFAEYRSGDQRSVVVAIKTEGLNRLTASPLGYVLQSPISLTRADISSLRITSSEGQDRLVVKPKLDSWEVGGTVASPSQKSAIERLLGVMSQENAGFISVLKDGLNADGSEAPFVTVGVIEITDRSGRTAIVDAGIEASSGTISLSLKRSLGDGVELVWVLESQDASGTGAWLAAMGAEDSRGN